MRKLSAVLVALVCSNAVGCCSVLPESKYKSKYGIPMRGSVTEEQVKKIDELLSVFPAEVIQSVRSFSLRDRVHFPNHEIGHYMWNCRICIAEAFFVSPYTVWHEVGHAYAFYLDFKSPKFRDKWKEIKGGVLTLYGATNYKEDIAEWVMEVYAFATGRISIITYMKTSGEFFKEPYLRKLRLLYKFGFITKENYYKVLEK